MGWLFRGRQYSHVLINKPRKQCAILRLAVLAHECEHIRRGDLDSGSPFALDSFAEAACEGAAERRIEQTAQLIGSSVDGASILDPDICQKCYRDGGVECRQAYRVYQRVQSGLPGRRQSIRRGRGPCQEPRPACSALQAPWPVPE